MKFSHNLLTLLQYVYDFVSSVKKKFILYTNVDSKILKLQNPHILNFSRGLKIFKSKTIGEKWWSMQENGTFLLI